MIHIIDGNQQIFDPMEVVYTKDMTRSVLPIARGVEALNRQGILDS